MECERKGKLIGGCKFQPRYDEHPADFYELGFKSVNLALIKELKVKTYVCDVCTKCGKTIKRD